MSMTIRAEGPAGSGAKPRAERYLTGAMVLTILLAFFGVVFGANAVMITLALSTMPGTVVDSSYRSGNAYRHEIAAFEAQNARQWVVATRVDRGSDGQVRIVTDMRDKTGSALTGLAVTARMGRPMDKRTDRMLDLPEVTPGRYEAIVLESGLGAFDLDVLAGRNGERLYKAQNRLTLN